MTRSWKFVRRLFGAPEEPEPDHEPDVPSRRQSVDLRPFAETNNDFAIAVYRLLRQRPGNLLFSPFSIRTALGMVYAGAEGGTAAQMSEALKFPSSGETLHLAVAGVLEGLNTVRAGGSEMVVANSLWGQKGLPLLPGFVNVMTRHYGGALNVVDFRHAPNAARASINHWVEDRTRKKIRELIPAGSVDAETRLVLANAVYFKGRWVLLFPEMATRAEPFHVQNGLEKQVPLMRQHGQVRYLKGPGYQAVDLLYEGGGLSMLVLLPDERDGLRDLEGELSARMLGDLAARIGVSEVRLFLPRFKLTWGTVDLRDELTALGMSLPFDRHQADFSGMTGHKAPHEDSVYISSVFHKAFAEVNERGTEAAAATAAAMTLGLPLKEAPVPIFRADHPFLFAIRDRQSGTILFLGCVVDPTREG